MFEPTIEELQLKVELLEHKVKESEKILFNIRKLKMLSYNATTVEIVNVINEITNNKKRTGV